MINNLISNEANNSTVSTIRFSIPVVFPGCDTPKRDYIGCG